jgi:hypothetical protein
VLTTHLKEPARHDGGPAVVLTGFAGRCETAGISGYCRPNRPGNPNREIVLQEEKRICLKTDFSPSENRAFENAHAGGYEENGQKRVRLGVLNFGADSNFFR